MFGLKILVQVQTVFEKDLVGSKILERNVFVSSSEKKAEKEQSDHETKLFGKDPSRLCATSATLVPS